MLKLQALDNTSVEIVRMVESWGSRCYCWLDCSVGMENWVQERLPKYTYKERDAVGHVQPLMIRLDRTTNRIRNFQVILASPPLPMLGPIPSPIKRMMGIPQFDVSAWPKDQEGIPGSIACDLRVGWLSSHELSILVTDEICHATTECMLNPTVSFLFDDRETLVGIVMRSLSRTDKVIIDHLPPSV